MKSCGGCGTWIPDAAGDCPSCGRPQGAPGSPPAPDPAPAPAAPGPEPPPGPPRPGPEFRARTEERIRRLGLLYVGVGASLLLFDLYSFHAFASGNALRDIKALAERFPPEAGDMVLDLWQEPAVLALAHLLPFALGVLLVWAGSGLRSLRGRTAALVGAVLCIVLACGLRDCCCLSMPFGVFALVVLTRPDVEAVLRAGPVGAGARRAD